MDVRDAIHQPAEEYVVLVDDDNNEIGLALKSEVHTATTPLHRAFSVFLFNSQGKLLLQQRSFSKKTWPGVWSNSCCGHPGPGEATLDAAERRLVQELGASVEPLWNVLPDFRYRVMLDGIVENELCPVFVGFTDEAVRPNPDEVAATRWVAWLDFLQEISRPDPPYSPWCVLEAQQLIGSPNFQRLFEQHTA